MALFAGTFQIDHLLAAEDAELLTPLGAKAREERGHTVIIVLAPFLKRMMVALGATHAYAEEKLAGRLGPVGGPARNHEIVGRPLGKRAPLGRDDVADHFIHRLLV